MWIYAHISRVTRQVLTTEKYVSRPAADNNETHILRSIIFFRTSIETIQNVPESSPTHQPTPELTLHLTVFTMLEENSVLYF